MHFYISINYDNHYFRALGIPKCAQLERYLYHSQDLVMSYVTPRVLKAAWKVGGSRPLNLDTILEKWTLYERQSTIQVAAIKEAILGPLANHWRDGNGDLPDDIICQHLQVKVPDLFARRNLELRQISERGIIYIYIYKYIFMNLYIYI